MASNPPFSAGRVLGRTFPIWTRNIASLTLLSAIIYSPLLLHAALAFPKDEEDPHAFIAVQNWGQVLLGFMATAAMIHGVFQQLRGQPVGIGACLRVCLRRFFPVLGVSLLTGLVIFVCILPIGFLAGLAGGKNAAPLGLTAAVIVGVILYCMFWVAVPVAVVEKPGVGASLTRSQALTRGHRFSIFLVLLVVGAILIATNMAVLMLVEDDRIATWAGLFVTIVIGAINAVAVAVGYHDLRVAKEGVGIEQLVSVFA